MQLTLCARVNALIVVHSGPRLHDASVGKHGNGAPPDRLERIGSQRVGPSTLARLEIVFDQRIRSRENDRVGSEAANQVRIPRHSGTVHGDPLERRRIVSEYFRSPRK